MHRGIRIVRGNRNPRDEGVQLPNHQDETVEFILSSVQMDANQFTKQFGDRLPRRACPLAVPGRRGNGIPSKLNIVSGCKGQRFEINEASPQHDR